MTDVALAAGFGSLRRFNDLFQRMYRRPPSQLRRQQRGARSGGGSEIQLLLSYAPPYDWAGILEFLAARSIPGLEEIDNGRYRRTIELNGSHGLIEVGPAVGRNALAVTIRFPVLKALPSIVERIRVMFDLNADITQIGRELATDPQLAPLVHARPGLRVPGSWDGFEQAVRAVLGQQITVSAARQLGAVLIERFGTPIIPAYGPSLKFVFPPAERLADADLGILRIPRARAATLSVVAAAAAADGTLFESQGSLDAVVARLRALRGVGEWTAQYIAMRAAREPDAFPAADVGLLNAMARHDGVRPTPAALLERAEAWRPWRAYAAQHLWTSGRASGAQVLLGGSERPALRTTDNKDAVA
jgi:AraC family transcriptional regulator of adaptative response / DNA-3-methyladenine glycosylase II